MKGRNLPHGNSQQHKIPDLEIIDLEKENSSASQASDSPSDPQSADSLPASEEKDSAKAPNRRFRVNVHMVLLAVAVLFVVGIVYKVKNFGVYVDLDEIFADGPGEYDDSYDTILPLLDVSSNPVYKDYSQGSTILAFGNAPFADDRGSEDNLVNIMQQETGATIYNCSISGSHLAAQLKKPDPEKAPWDVFNPYWLCNIAAKNEAAGEDYQQALKVLGSAAPPEAREVYDILQSIDFNTVDAIVLMYDASDYLDGLPMFNPEDATDITTFTGTTEAVIEYMQFFFPNVRIIVLSPTYAFALDDDGKYISSDMKRYGQDVLSTYAILQYASCVSRSVTFVDNIYNTFNEDNAKKYLSDHLHLNVKGRKKVAERFAYALNYYNQNRSAEGEKD